jgi:hypothetical protein
MHKSFPKEELQTLVECGGSKTLKKVDSGRIWSLHYELIFQDTADGAYYRTGYSRIRGAIHLQDESSFEYDSDMIQCTRVEQRFVKEAKWVPIGDSEPECPTCGAKSIKV